MDKRRVCEVVENTELAADIVWLRLDFGADPDGEMKPGRFVHILPPGRPDLILRRPFGVNDYDAGTGLLDIVCQMVGKGSEAIAAAKKGDKLDVFGPAGNGFPAPTGSVWLVGGGIGCSPLNYLPLYYTQNEFTAIYGFRSAEHIYQLDIMEKLCKEVVLMTDDGSAGQKGFVTDALRQKLAQGARPDCIMACGPTAMLKGLHDVLSSERCLDIPCYVSLEQRMGCGMGACYTCTCDTLVQDGSGNMKRGNARVCLEGPVFPMGAIW